MKGPAAEAVNIIKARSNSYSDQTSRNALGMVIYIGFRLFRLAVNGVGTGGGANLYVNLQYFETRATQGDQCFRL